MNYHTWSQEYYRDAKNIAEVIKKYEKQLKSRRSVNLENLNAIIAAYRKIYYDLLDSAHILEARAGDDRDAA